MAVPLFGGSFFALLPLRIGSAFAPVGLLAQFREVFRLMTRPSGALLISFGVAVISVGLLAIAWHSAGGAGWRQATCHSAHGGPDRRLLQRRIQAGWRLVDFDSSANTERCETIDELRDLAVSDTELRKMNLVAAHLDDAAHNHYGQLFCDRASL